MAASASDPKLNNKTENTNASHTVPVFSGDGTQNELTAGGHGVVPAGTYAERAAGEIAAPLSYPSSNLLEGLHAWTPWIVRIAAVLTAVCALFLPFDAHETHPWGLPLVLLLWVWLGGVALCFKYGVKHWKHRTQALIDAIRREIAESRETANTEDDKVLNKIEERKQHWTAEADKYRDLRTRLAAVSAFLGPLAVLLLAIQIIAVKEPLTENMLWAARLLIGAEAGVILLAIATIYHNHWPFNKFPKSWMPVYVHEMWIPSRLTSELLQREIFLYITRLGPYFRCEDKQSLEAITDARLLKLKAYTGGHLETSKLIEFLEMQSDGKYWRDELEDADSNTPSLSSPGLDALIIYEQDRLLDQMNLYFLPRSKRHALQDKAFESVAHLALGLALILAILHMRLLMLSEVSRDDVFHKAVEISALVMPALGAGCITLRTFFEDHRLSHSYRNQAEQLEVLYAKFETLRRDWLNEPADNFKYVHQFQRLVLRTETLLAFELRRWWLIVEPEHPIGGP